MAEALLLVVVGSLIPISVATLVFALLILRKAHLYVRLAEQRFEYLREGQVLLLALLREQSRSSDEEQEHRTQEQERVLQEHERLALAVHARRTGGGQGIDEPGLRLHDLWGAGRDADVEPEGRSSLEEEPPKEQRTESQPRAANFPDTTSSQPAKAPPDDEVSRRAVWHPHPDDDVSPARADGPGDATVEMFRRHYDKYLDNYEGYVKLAGRLFRMRDDAEVVPGSVAEREWDDRLRRVTDGIQRTTARLDILEEYNPELATDDRISRRAAIARNHRELEIKKQERQDPEGPG